MEPEFWHQTWEEGDIKFHEAEVNPALVRHLPALDLSPGARVFVPLCGKTRDIAWLLAQGFRVAGAELSRLAVEQLFDELKVVPTVAASNAVMRFSADGVDIFAGDIFDLTRSQLGQLQASYDRAALVALPPDMRARYATHMCALTGGAPQLLVCFEYSDGLPDGPPFSVPADEVVRVYGAVYRADILASKPMRNGLRGHEAIQTVWHLRDARP